MAYQMGVVPDSTSLVAGYLEFSDSDSDDYCTNDERVKIKKKAVRGKVVGGEKTVRTTKARVVPVSKLLPKKAVQNVSSVSLSLNTLQSHLIYILVSPLVMITIAPQHLLRLSRLGGPTARNSRSSRKPSLRNPHLQSSSSGSLPGTVWCLKCCI